MISVEYVSVSLAAQEWEAVETVAQRDEPEFAEGLAHGVEVDLITQPFFPRHRVIEVKTLVPAQRVHMVLTEDGHAMMLSGRLPVFNSVVAKDPPPLIGEQGTARIYGNLCDFWTRESRLGELPIDHFGDIPFLEDLDPIEQQLMDDLEEAVGSLIGPLHMEEYEDGFLMVKWLVSEQRLICRVLEITYGGEVARTEEVFDNMLPVHAGNYWGMRDGRLVPIG
jgi:hypothetical protein